MSDFDKQVILDCYRSTGSKVWNDEVFYWFYRNDFIPSNWREDYELFLSEISD